MVEKQFIPSSPTPDAWREIEDGVIALHDALKSAGDFDGRELIECVRFRLERSLAELRNGFNRGAEGAESQEERGAE